MSERKERGGWQDIPGWTSDSFRAQYDEFVELAVDGDTIVEIGVAFGRSLAYLEERVIASGKALSIIACDPWRDDWWMPPNDYPLDAPRPTWGGEHAEWARSLGGPFDAFMHAYKAHAPQYAGTQILRTHSRSLRETLSTRMPGPRFVMIDGNHNYEQVLDDLEWRHLLPAGGILAGDDYTTEFPGVIRACAEVFGPLGSSPTFSVRGNTWRWQKRGEAA